MTDAGECSVLSLSLSLSLCETKFSVFLSLSVCETTLDWYSYTITLSLQDHVLCLAP
jgi:hypothetical protein